jgi:hypothetical protein
VNGRSVLTGHADDIAHGQHGIEVELTTSAARVTGFLNRAPACRLHRKADRFDAERQLHGVCGYRDRTRRPAWSHKKHCCAMRHVTGYYTMQHFFLDRFISFVSNSPTNARTRISHGR